MTKLFEDFRKFFTWGAEEPQLNFLKNKRNGDQITGKKL